MSAPALPESAPTLAESAAALASGRISSVELTELSLARIKALNDRLAAYIEVTEERARASARAADAARAAGTAGPLAGIPYALKDIYDAAGIRTTAHSRLLLDNIAERDAAATAALERAGMVLTGKLATHEFARGGPDPDLAFPNAKNPWAVDRFAGGSSSGSAAAVASGMVAMAMGSDTGGSIRIPAAYCGVVGLKPTYGRVSRRGVAPLSFSLDHVGPLAATVEDCALTLQVVTGHDPHDANSGRVPVPDYSAALKAGVRGMKIGRARALDAQSKIGAEGMAALEAAEAVFRALGAEVVDVETPDRDLMDAVAWAIVQAEGVSIHGQDLRERPELYGRTTRERLMIGAFATGAQYVTAQRLRPILSAEIERALTGCDAILCAPVTGPAPLLSDVDDLPWRKQPPITGCFNMTGQPAISVPAGLSAEGLPLSIQLVGRSWDEAGLLRVAWAYEQEAGWRGLRPSL